MRFPNRITLYILVLCVALVCANPYLAVVPIAILLLDCVRFYYYTPTQWAQLRWGTKIHSVNPIEFDDTILSVADDTIYAYVIVHPKNISISRVRSGVSDMETFDIRKIRKALTEYGTKIASAHIISLTKRSTESLYLRSMGRVPIPLSAITILRIGVNVKDNISAGELRRMDEKESASLGLMRAVSTTARRAARSLLTQGYSAHIITAEEFTHYASLCSVKKDYTAVLLPNWDETDVWRYSDYSGLLWDINTGGGALLYDHRYANDLPESLRSTPTVEKLLIADFRPLEHVTFPYPTMKNPLVYVDGCGIYVGVSPHGDITFINVDRVNSNMVWHSEGKILLVGENRQYESAMQGSQDAGETDAEWVFDQFKARVLWTDSIARPAQETLDRIVKEGDADIVFTYEFEGKKAKVQFQDLKSRQEYSWITVKTESEYRQISSLLNLTAQPTVKHPIDAADQKQLV